MILSGPKDCRGSTKDAKILPVFLHSPGSCQQCYNTEWRLEGYVLLMEEGSGLLRLKGIVYVCTRNYSRCAEGVKYEGR
jgi:hypothetical protein